MEFRIKVRWRAAIQKMSEYNFASEAELEAFKLGADEAVGWMEWDFRTPDHSDFDSFGTEDDMEQEGSAPGATKPRAHAYDVVAVEATRDDDDPDVEPGLDNKMVRWCRRCGTLEISWRPWTASDKSWRTPGSDALTVEPPCVQ